MGITNFGWIDHLENIYSVCIYFEQVTSIEDIDAADHLIWNDWDVIVRNVNYEEEAVTLTGLEAHFQKDGMKTEIVTKKKKFADLEGSLLKVEYENVKIIKKSK